MKTFNLVVLKAKFAHERAVSSIMRYFEYLDAIPENTTKLPEEWGIGLQRHEALIDLDLNALLISTHQLFKYCKKIKQCSEIVPANMAEVITILRNNYEHWDENEKFFQKNNSLRPTYSAKQFIEKYRTKSGERPKGSFAIDWNEIDGEYRPSIVQSQFNYTTTDRFLGTIS